MKSLYVEPYFYTVSYHKATDESFLEVACGTTAIYEVQIRLTGKEKQEFLENPDSIFSLAYQVSDAPDSFLKRKI